MMTCAIKILTLIIAILTLMAMKTRIKNLIPSFFQALLLVAAGGVVDGQLLGENDINTEPVDKAKDATKEVEGEAKQSK